MMSRAGPGYKIVSFGSDTYKQCVDLRTDILRAPLGQGFTQDELAADEHNLQIAGVDNGRVVCTASIALDPDEGQAKVQRVAVAQDAQGQGIGRGLMLFCEECAAKEAMVLVYVHARDTAIPFYRCIGYNEEGPFFDEDGIPHKKMTKILPV